MPWCKHCQEVCPTIRDEDRGYICCQGCGRVLDQDIYFSGVTFEKTSSGQSRLAGTYIRSVQSEYSLSHERTLMKGRDEIRGIVVSLSVAGGDSIIDQAHALYTIAVERNFTRGRITSQVAAACLYIACRQNMKPYLLIDFSDFLQVNVYVLGAVFLQLCQLLRLEEHPIVQKPVDPSLFIHRFAERLLGEKNSEVIKIALRIIASMKRDWMQTGRKPSGLCGAALYIAALSQGLKYCKSDVQLKLDPIAKEGVFTSKGPRNTGSSTGLQTTFKESCNQPPIDDVQGDAVDEDNLSDIDDVEVGSYLHSEEEKQLKTIIWDKMNKEYIEEQAAKEAAAAAAKEAYDAAFANCSDDIRSAQELAAAATAAAAKFRKERKQKRAEEVKNSAPPRTAAEATRQVLKRKGFSSKINYDALDTLFTSDDGQKKKQHIESDNSGKPVKHDAEEQNELHDSSLKDYHNDHKAAHDTVEWDDDAGGEYDDDYNYGSEDDFEFELY